jgi:type II secretory pathway pseudopilin PulG
MKPPDREKGILIMTRSRVNPRSTDPQKGFSLAVVVVATTILLVGLSEAVINWQKAMQREREEELIFRGKQFMRAIELWQRKFPGTYPTTLDALLNTNNMRFLRKKWKDPITNSEEWRLIKLNPDGTISGLTVIPSSSTGLQDVNVPGAPTSGRGPSTGTSLGGSRSGQTGMTLKSPQDMGSVRASDPRRSTLQSSASPVLGGIVGVASKSQKESLKTYNGRNKYNEWEFYYVPKPQAQQQMPQGQRPPGSQVPGAGSLPGSRTGQPSGTSPFQR